MPILTAKSSDEARGGEGGWNPIDMQSMQNTLFLLLLRPIFLLYKRKIGNKNVTALTQDSVAKLDPNAGKELFFFFF